MCFRSRGWSAVAIAVVLVGASACAEAPPAPEAVVIVPVSADSSFQGGRADPDVINRELRAGRTSSEPFVSYLSFQVTALPAGDGPLQATVTLTALGGMAGLVELTEVAIPASPAGGPVVLGQVMGTRHLGADAHEVSFDVSRVVTGKGGHTFALTRPDRVVARFGSSETETGAPLLRLRRDGSHVNRSKTPAYHPAAPVAGTSRAGAGCVVGPKLVPSCGVLTGVSPAAHTRQPRDEALREFERASGRDQRIYHAYHRGEELFPTPAEIALAREPGRPRLLFLNWKPRGLTWGQIADGEYDPTIDRLAAHIAATYTDPFFLTVHHEPENDVVAANGSGMTAKDYAAMFRHVVQRLRAKGAPNIVTVMNYMSYVRWNTQPWFADLYPGDDVVDWVGWDVYANSDPGHAHGDFGELVNRTSSQATWPGIYSWAAQTFPDKPLMVAEWGVWQSEANPGHKPWLYHNAATQMALFPRVKALVYFDSPAAESRDSRVTATPEAQQAYRDLMNHPMFDVH